MDGAGEAVTYSTELTHKAGGALKEIVTIIAEAADRIGSIATAAEQQSAASEESTAPWRRSPKSPPRPPRAWPAPPRPSATLRASPKTSRASIDE